MRRPTSSGYRLRHPSTWTLRSKLVTSTVALFIAITLATGVTTILALNTFLTSQLDAQVTASAGRAAGGDDHDRALRADGDTRTSRPDGPPPGLGGGFLLLEVTNGTATTRNAARTPSGQDASLTPAQVSAVLRAGVGGQPKTVDLGDELGTWRLAASPSRTDPGGTVVTGLPMGPQQDTVARLGLIVAVVTGFGLLLVAAGAAWLARSTLRPLRRVAATATRVSHLPLDSGAVALAERVPASDTDPHTEVGQVGSALNGLLDHVGAALTARHESEMRVRQFVADASHELRTPLASIRGYAELSRREREPVPPSVRHALGRVESEATRMAVLVDDLLLLARLDAGRPLDKEQVDVTRIVVDAVSDAHAAGPNHIWQLDVPDESAYVCGDPARLHQVVANLLANARTHTPPGTTVSARVKHVDGEVRVSVDDNGPGIPEALQPNVFARFTRGDSSRSRAAGSTGLGLSIVQAVTQAHGGRVDLASKPGSTSFQVALPAA
jgi:two-component system, OmpR family, sensor kinase